LSTAAALHPPFRPPPQWSDINRFWRDVSSVFDNRVVGVPLDGDMFMMYYRSAGGGGSTVR
jgi:hypothetical protein